MLRPALHADKFMVITMLKAAHEAAKFDFEFSAAYASQVFDHHMGNADRYCLILEEGGRAVGMLLGIVTQHPFGPFKIAAETCWWVNEEFRGKSSSQMLDAYEGWAASRGCRFVMMAAMSVAPRAGSIYRRRGYEAVETHYIKRI